MLDSHFRSSYQKILVDPIIKIPFLKKTHPNSLTLLGCLIGILASVFIAIDQRFIAIALLLLSGYFDTLDGSIARTYLKKSNFGSALDIFSDRVVEFFVILSFYLLDPSRALLCLLMLGSAYLCVTSFLVIGIFTENDTQKSFHYSAGIMERTETFIFFFLMIVFPKYFVYLASIFSFLVFLTALIRIVEFSKQFTLDQKT